MGKNVNVKSPVEKGVANVPVVMQLEALECGAACLTMVLAYYDKWIPLEQVRYDCDVSRDGSNAKNILLAARGYGLDASAYKVEPEMLKEGGSFPCIIHWDFNHFVVLCGFKGGKAYLNDPARGNVAVTMEEFDESFTGICLMFEPTSKFEASGKPKSMVSYARKRLKGAGVAVAFVVLTSIITSLMGIINPAFSRMFMDWFLEQGRTSWTTVFIGMMSGFALIQIVVGVINAIYSLRINGKLAVVGNTSYMWKVLRMPMEFFSQRMAGDIQMRQESNANIAKGLVDTFAPLFIDFCMMIFYLVVMLRYSPILTLVGVFSIVINLFTSSFISKKRVNITRVQMRDAGKLAAATVSGIEMIETIKASGAENGFFMKWSGYQASVNNQQVSFVKLNQYLGMIPALVNSIADTVVLILGVYFCMQGEFSVGSIMAFQGFLGSFTGPAMTLIQAGQALQEMRTEMERVEDVMEYPCDVEFAEEDDENAEFKKLSGQMEMKNVTFGYSRLGEPLIKDFNLSLKPGSRVAFVGQSGCGKSTLAKLISGLYSPWSGEITFDGKNIKDIDHSVFTGSLAVVNQEIVLFEDTIAENIRMWDKSIEDFEVIMAARDAKLHDDIMERPGGYEYKITEGGKDFSGGQRQRMEIARVLAQDPTIIILDEATSALDAKTEYEVVNAIKERGITCIVVAHRLSTIRDCDEIVVMDHGDVVERGTHDELYKKGGLYTQLVSNE